MEDSLILLPIMIIQTLMYFFLWILLKRRR